MKTQIKCRCFRNICKTNQLNSRNESKLDKLRHTYINLSSFSGMKEFK